MNHSHYTRIEICKITGLRETDLDLFREREWLTPFQDTALDEEDLARIQLILELKERLGANDDSIPLILHLMDQIHYLRRRMMDAKARPIQGD